MSLFDAILARRRATDQAAGESAPVALGERPSWTTETGLFEAVSRPLVAGPGTDVTAVEGAEPLPQRPMASMIWRTRFGQDVGVGDLVALSLLAHPDAQGWIVGPSEDGRVLCTLNTKAAETGPKPLVTVDADYLLLLLRKGEEPPAETPRSPGGQGRAG